MYSQSVSRRGGGGWGGDREHGENDVYNWQNIILVDMSVYVCTCTGDKNMKK
jgi:hypothetical protein